MDAEGPTSGDAPVNPGERLRAARVRAGWSVEQVAHRLRLSPSLVTALEGGRREELPPPAYVRGYLRSYAQLLGLDPQEFAKARVAHDSGSPPPIAPSAAPKTGRIAPGAIVYGLILAGLVVAAALWHRHERDRQAAAVAAPTAAPVTGLLPPRLTSLAAPGERHGEMRTFPLRTATPGQPPAVPRPAPVRARGGAARPAAPVRPVVMARAAAAGVLRPAPSPPAARTPAASRTPAPAAAPALAVPNPGGLVSLPLGHRYVGLRISASDAPVRVLVRDARGTRLMAGRIAVGHTVYLMGRAPFRLTLSRSRGVVVRVGGRAVALPNAQPGQSLQVTVDP